MDTLWFDNHPSVWEYFQQCRLPVVLYGMGNGADKVFAAFEQYGIAVAAVMASDDFVRGQCFHGFRVKTCGEVEAEFGEFVVALCFASQLPGVMEQIRRVAAAHKTLCPAVPVFGDRLFDKSFIREHTTEMQTARGLLADSFSGKVYEHVLRFYHTGALSLLDEITTDRDEAFGLLDLGDNEVYVDLGAYNGDTIDEFLHYTGGSYRKIIALEPNDKNFAKLRVHCAGIMVRVELWQLGAWKENTVLYFNNKAGRNSAIAAQGTATRVAAVDTLLCGIRAGYVKADVEGADYETLLGLRRTLRDRPKLNFSAYHRFEDIFRLPLLIRKLNPGYRMYLRHHPYYPAWDTNLYCV